MRSEKPSPTSPQRNLASTLALGIVLTVGVASPAHATDEPPPAHDACGQDGGSYRGDAGIGDYVFSDPVAAPVQGGRWEPACSASPGTAGTGAAASLFALAALGLVIRRRAR